MESAGREKRKRLARHVEAWLLAVLLLAGPVPAALAADGAGDEAPARDISFECRFSVKRILYSKHYLDREHYFSSFLPAGEKLRISADEPIGALYLENDIPAGRVTVETENGTVETDPGEFLHFCVQGFRGQEVALSFENDVWLNDLYVFTPGVLPDWVQIWEPPLTEPDVLILATHHDDEQLYFGGAMAWALDRGASVQVAHFCYHQGLIYRFHEVLDGLWNTGVRNYPILGEYPDTSNLSERVVAAQLAGRGFTFDDMVLRQTVMFRRVKPRVVLTHSLTGEYGHGAHVLCQKAALAAAELCADADYDPASALEYGLWDIPKVYVHNYVPEGGAPVLLDLDSPLERYGGRTAYEVMTESYFCHKSQSTDMFFTWWLTAPGCAAGIENYSPREWGLYRTSVGPDESTDSLFDHVLITRQREALAAQEQARQEQLENRRRFVADCLETLMPFLPEAAGRYAAAALIGE